MCFHILLVPERLLIGLAGGFFFASDLAVARHLQNQQGRYTRVLMESSRKGRTETFAETEFATDNPEGQIVDARITGVSGQLLLGEKV